MARYIDAEKLCKALRDMAFYQNPYKQSTILGVVESIEQFPTADVVPRAMIAEIFLRIREEFSISELGKSALNQLEAELKKKYTEGEK